MQNLAKLLNYTELKGLTPEIYGPCTRIRIYNDTVIKFETSYTLEFGFLSNEKRFIYSWFKGFSVDAKELSMEMDMWFDHNYNQNTGNTRKGFTTGFKLSIKIDEYLNQFNQNTTTTNNSPIEPTTMNTTNQAKEIITIEVLNKTYQVEFTTGIMSYADESLLEHCIIKIDADTVTMRINQGFAPLQAVQSVIEGTFQTRSNADVHPDVNLKVTEVAKSEALANYSEKLVAAQNEEAKRIGSPYISRVENPKGTCKTLWIPQYTGNRVAAINLNHTVMGFDENGILWGMNGNCGTQYAIIEVPTEWENTHVNQLATLVAQKLDKPEGYPAIRALKADDRLQVIIDTVKEVEL